MPLEVHSSAICKRPACLPALPICAWTRTLRSSFIPWAAPPELDRGKCGRAAKRVFDPKRVRIQATIAGYSTAGREEDCDAAPEREDAADQDGGRAGERPRASGISGARRLVRIQSRRSAHRFRRMRCRPTITSISRWSAPIRRRFCSSTTDAGRARRLYFRAALDASADAPFTMEVQSPESAAAANLSTYAFVVLTDPGTLPPSLSDALSTTSRNGGSVLVALGPASAVLPRVPVADEAIDSTRYAGREGERFLSVSDLDTGHPALQSVERFDGVKFYQAIHVTPTKSRVLAKLDDQTPLVLERQIGEGKVLVFTSTFDNISNDLPLHASWVPFVQQSVAYLGGGGPEQPVNVTTGSYVELRTADSQKRRGRSAGSRRQARVVAGRGDQGAQFRAGSRRVITK